MSGVAGGERRALRALARRSDRRGFYQLAGHLGALVLTGTMVLHATGAWLLPAMLVHGIVLVFLFAALHETVHRTAFRSHRINDGVALALGLSLVLPPTWFRSFHFAHHRYTQDPERDPELGVAKPASPVAWAWHVSGLPFWRDRLLGIVRQALGVVREPYVPANLRPEVVREARLYLSAYALVGLLATATWSPLPLLLWIGPALLGQPFLRLYLLPEHSGCPLIPDMFRNTRTTLTNRLIRRLAWNMPYHAEHHAYPALPFHALPAAHELLSERLGVTGDGYVRVNLEILRDLGRDSAAPNNRSGDERGTHAQPSIR
jgi:fatty acid desaturase